MGRRYNKAGKLFCKRKYLEYSNILELIELDLLYCDAKYAKEAGPSRQGQPLVMSTPEVL